MKRLMLNLWAGRACRAARIGIAGAVVLLGLLAPAFAESRMPAKQETGAVSYEATKSTPASVAAPFPDQTQYSAERVLLENDPDLRQGFPNLGSDFVVLAPGTRDYNCIAHSLGDHNHWVNPPRNGPEENPLSYADQMYKAVGYTRLPGLDFNLEAGKQKVVLYGTVNSDGTLKEITHAALQDVDGTWTSKLGRLPLIRHPTPEALRGLSYGLPIAVYVRDAA